MNKKCLSLKYLISDLFFLSKGFAKENLDQASV